MCSFKSSGNIQKKAGRPFRSVSNNKLSLMTLNEPEKTYCNYVFQQGSQSMEGDLSKKSIHINESFIHAIYIGIVVNSYSDIVAYI